MAILNYLKYSIIKGGKPVIDCIAKDISEVKDVALLGYVYKKTLDFKDERETIKTIREMLATYDNDNDNDNDNDSIVGRNDTRIVTRIVEKEEKRFKKPSLDEIRSYIIEQKSTVNPETFFDYYEANGWVVGKSKMKDWKATVRNWSRRENKAQPAVTKSPPKKEIRGVSRMSAQINLAEVIDNGSYRAHLIRQNRQGKNLH